MDTDIPKALGRAPRTRRVASRLYVCPTLAYGLASIAFFAGGLAGPMHPAQAASASVVLSIDKGPPGTPLSITGSGFPPNEVVALYIDSPAVYLEQPGPVADSHGSFQENFKWPGKTYDPSGAIDPTTVGLHTICGDTGYPSSTQPVAMKACAQFVVEASANATPTSGAQPGLVGPSLPVPVVLVGFGVLLALAVAAYWFTREST